MKRNRLKETWMNVVVSAALVLAGTALAVAQLDLWTVNGQDPHVYVDAAYDNGALQIDPFLKEAGSTTELDPRLTVTQNGGSATETNYYVATVGERGDLPVTTPVYRASGSDWRRTGSSLGTLRIDQGNRTAIKGSLFSEAVNATAEPAP